MKKDTDILIVGGGSAGFGAAWRALHSGRYRVAVIEPNPGLGGTSTYGGVNCWEPGCGGAGVHRRLAERLMAEGNGFVGKTYGYPVPEAPWGRSGRCEDPYEETLIRSLRTGPEQRRFHFEPEAMSAAMMDLLREADRNERAEFLLGSRAVSVRTEGRMIHEVTAETPEGRQIIRPRLVLDCTGDIVIARAAGCACMAGEDSCRAFSEPDAPQEAQRSVNGLSLIFRVTPCPGDEPEEIPAEYADVDLTDWLRALDETNCPASCFNEYPNGDININMLPTLPGEYWLDHSFEEVMHICRARVYAYWNWVQTKKRFTGYRIREIFPMIGVRESWRLKGRYVLKEQDLRNGYSEELGAGHTIAFSDHPIDIHGKPGAFGMTMFPPYGIPYECMLPNEIDNLLVACRGASFSHIAASSARLSRTMIALGEAAGEAAVQCLDGGCLPAEADIEKLREALGIR